MYISYINQNAPFQAGKRENQTCRPEGSIFCAPGGALSHVVHLFHGGFHFLSDDKCRDQ